MAEPTKFITTHTVQPGETLSHLTLKYYGSTAREKWMVIYEANKGMIGHDPGKILPGWELKIPVEGQETSRPPAPSAGLAGQAHQVQNPTATPIKAGSPAQGKKIDQT